MGEYSKSLRDVIALLDPKRAGRPVSAQTKKALNVPLAKSNNTTTRTKAKSSKQKVETTRP